MKLGSCSFGSLTMPLRTSSAWKALAASRAAASASASERPLTMNFLTANLRLVSPFLLPLESYFGIGTFQAQQVRFQPTPGTPLCFIKLSLLNLFGLSTSAEAGASIVCGAALAASLRIASLGFSSSAAAPTDSKTSTPCMAPLPPVDVSRRRPFSSKAQPRPAQTEVGKSLIQGHIFMQSMPRTL